MSEEMRKALRTFAIRLGFASQALDDVLKAMDAEESPKSAPRHPFCVAALCGQVDCGRAGPCYVNIADMMRVAHISSESEPNQRPPAQGGEGA